MLHIGVRSAFNGSKLADLDTEQIPAKYQKLRDFLKAREWKGADEETARVMLQVADREAEGWFIPF